MPCLTDEIDCLICGARTKCTQMDEPNLGATKKWSEYLCQFFSVSEDNSFFEETIREALYCVDCVSKITSVVKISRLVEDMTLKLEERKGKIEECLLLSNPHISSDDREKNQNTAREKIMSALDDVKKRLSDKSSVDANVATDPVIIVHQECQTQIEHGQSPEPEHYFVMLNENSNECMLNQGTSDKECQCSLITENVSLALNDNEYSGSDVPMVETTNEVSENDGRKRQLIKIRISSDSVSQEIIDTLKRQQGSTQSRQLIIRGYREIEHEQEVSQTKNARGSSKNSATPTRKRKPKKLEVASDQPVRNSPKSQGCKICGANFDTQLEIKNHIEETHKDGNFFKCADCDKRPVSLGGLIRHRSSVHTRTTVDAKENVENTETVEPADHNEDEEEEAPVESDPEYGCSSEEEDDDEIVVSPRKVKRRSKDSPAKPAKRARRPKADPVIKVSSNKQISGQVATSTPTTDQDPSPRKSGRLRSAYRTYFY